MVAIYQGGSLVGEVCHIKGAKSGAARYDMHQSAEDRHSFENLILLCRNHHAVIDDDPESYNIERLYKMKLDHKSQSTTLDHDLVERGSRLLIEQAIQSINQSGGITAGTVNINLHPTVVAESTTIDAPGPAAVGLFECSCFASSELIARTDSRDKDGQRTECVYWHHSPSAWLRIIPFHAQKYTRAALQRLVETAAIPLLPFGESASARSFPNQKGTAVIGIDGDLPATVTTRVTQVLHNGQIWGLNRAMIEPDAQEPSRTFRIHWNRMRREFESTLANYLCFARETLKFDHPITVVAGLAMVDGALFVREKTKWFTNQPKPHQCLEQFVSRSWQILQADIANEGMFEEFYSAVWDACALDYSKEPRSHTWPGFSDQR